MESQRRFKTPQKRELAFSRLGLGGAPLGNMGVVLSEAEADAVVASAWTGGVRYFDTAPLYGHGLSESRLGRALRGIPRDAYLLSSKVGRLLEPCAPGEEQAGIYLEVPQLRGVFDYSYDGVMRSYEASLARLGLERIDILFVHDIDTRNHGGGEACETRLRELMDGGGWRALDELRASREVLAIGAGVNEAEPCDRLLELADPDLFLLAGRYTLLEQGPVQGLLPRCLARGVGIVLGGPYNSGILAGGDAVRRFDYGAAPSEVVERVRRLEAVCRRFETPLAAAALQFVFAHPAVVSVVPGAQVATEVEDNLDAVRRPIPAELWQVLRAEGLIHPAAPTPATADAPC